VEDDEQKSLDQLIMHVSPTKIEQSTFSIEINEGNQQQHLVLVGTTSMKRYSFMVLMTLLLTIWNYEKHIC
jgi:hypothetical protein